MTSEYFPIRLYFSLQFRKHVFCISPTHSLTSPQLRLPPPRVGQVELPSRREKKITQLESFHGPCVGYLPCATPDPLSSLLHPLLLLCPLCLESHQPAATIPWASGFSLGSANGSHWQERGGQRTVGPGHLFLLLPSYWISVHELYPSSQAQFLSGGPSAFQTWPPSLSPSGLELVTCQQPQILHYSLFSLNLALAL